jgi:hypothetical protein
MEVAEEIYYDILALNPIVYILACRIGTFIKRYVKKNMLLVN